MQRKHFTLRFRDRSEARNVVWCSERVGRQARVRTSRGLVVNLVGGYLFLNVVCADELIKLFYMFDEDLNDARIKSSAGHIPQQSDGVFASHTLAVGPVATRGIIEVDHGNDTRYKRNVLALESFGIAGSIPLFVVIANDVFYGIGKVNSFQNVATDGGMDFHLCKFGFG